MKEVKKILIISLPRTGSTSLLERIAKQEELELKISEPFGEYGDESLIDFSKSMVVKTILHQGNKGIEFYKEWSKNFNHVILLSRRDLKECSESCAYMNYHLSNGFKHYQEYVYEQPPIYDEVAEWIYRTDFDLHQLGKLIDIEVKYYEDLFDKNSSERQRKSFIEKKIL